MVRKKNFKLIIAVALSALILLYQVTSYNDLSILEDFRNAYHRGTDSFKYILSDRITTNQVIFPYSFPVNGKLLKTFLLGSNSLVKLEAIDARTIKPDVLSGPLTSKLKEAKYTEHLLNIYTDKKHIGLDLDKCDTIKTSAMIEISTAKLINVSLKDILLDFIKEAEVNPYYKDISEFFMNDLKLQLKYNVVDHYWYRLAGSSVWLEEYQAHFMISRIMYSPRGQRNQPLVSLTYGQLFDKNWKEMTDTKIIVPTNNIKDLNNKSKALKQAEANAESEEPEEKHYKLIKFPYFLPIPFWYDLDNLSGKYFGPEDPRLILVKNKAGHEEPLIVFNAQHRKLVHFDDDSDNKILLKSEFYRSMFVCWPWQFQKGKANTDGFKHPLHDSKYFNKVIELKIKNIPRNHKQKNWTPFLSESLRSREGFDKYVNFIYRWANFEALRCDITYDTGICAFEYRLNPELDTKQAVGPFRGGTDLVNINSLLADHAKDFIPTDREIWVGFARAHIDDCGCGSNMYRPNLVVVTKDQITEDLDGKDHHKSIYKISHVSSSISFNIPIIGWNLLDPLDLCTGPNILIPNGISHWSIDSFSEGDLEDYLTLSLSVSDYTVHTIHIKGLLKQVLQLSEGHIFDQVVEDEYSEGFDNDNLVCALQSSTEFCAEYGRNNSVGSGDGFIPKIFDYDSFEELEAIEETKEFIEEDKDVAEYERAVYLQRLHEDYMKSHGPPTRQGKPSSKKPPSKAGSKDSTDDMKKGKSQGKDKSTPKEKPWKANKNQGSKSKEEVKEKLKDKLKTKPEKLTVTPGKMNTKPEGLKAEPEKLKPKTEKLKPKTEKLKAKPEQLKAKPQELKAKPQELKAKPQELKAKPENLKALKAKPQELKAKPENLKALKAKPQKPKAKPQELKAKPEQLKAKPEELIDKPKQLKDKPDELKSNTKKQESKKIIPSPEELDNPSILVLE